MTPDGNLNLQEEINNDKNGKYRDSKYVFSFFS